MNNGTRLAKPYFKVCIDAEVLECTNDVNSIAAAYDHPRVCAVPVAKILP